MKLPFFILLLASHFAFCQESCQKELSFFPLWNKSINTGNAKYDRLQIDKLDGYTLKVKNKVTAKIKSQLGPYKNNLRLDRMRVNTRTETKKKHFTYRYSVTIEGFRWGFEVSSTNSGKIDSELPFPKIKKRVIDPCEAKSRAEAQMHFEEAVGIKLSKLNGKLVWEIWEQGFSLQATPKDAGLKRTSHKIIFIDAKSEEIVKTGREKLERY